MTWIEIESRDDDELLRSVVKTMDTDELLEVLQCCIDIGNDVQKEIVRKELEGRHNSKSVIDIGKSPSDILGLHGPQEEIPSDS